MVALQIPTYKEERALLDRGVTLVAGVDEAGSGCWAGPVFAGAVIFPLDARLALVRDSKTLSASQRETLATQIKSCAIAWAVGSASHEEIDALNIRRAGALAMRRAIEALSPRPEHLLVDAFDIPGIGIPVTSIIRGDSLSKSIAAASILAKTSRDELMRELDVQYPGYGFAIHKGYGTAVHQEALRRLGPSPIHRLTYAPVRAAMAREI